MSTKSGLRTIFITVSQYGKLMKYPHTLPLQSSLPSLTKENPTIDELQKDYKTLSEHFVHPVFVNYVPSYEEHKICTESAWISRYSALVQLGKVIK